MTKQEFLQRLEVQLADVTEEERAEAIRFYEEYFDEAGPEQEQKVLLELGSPDKVAAIIKANVPGSRAEPRAAEQPAAEKSAPQLTLEGPDWAAARQPEQAGQPEAESAPGQPEHQIPLPMYARPQYRTQTTYEPAGGSYESDGAGYGRSAAPRRHMSNSAILFIVLAVLLFPAWGGLLTGVLGVLFGVLCVGFALMFAGLATVVAVIAILALNGAAAFAAGIPVGMLMVGICLLALTLGMLLFAGGLWFNFRALPALWRLLKKAVRAVFGQRNRKEA